MAARLARRAALFRWACECTDKSVPLGKYCLSRSIGVIVRPALPRALRIAKIYVDFVDQRKATMIRKFLAAVPGQGLIQFFW